ncbi:MAG: hypothetical protein WAU01_17465 [Saprospiraceae bacterium]
MSTFANYYSQTEQSVKPKTYFGGTQHLMKSRLVNSGIAIKGKTNTAGLRNSTIITNPYVKELLIVAPWVITGLMMAWMVIL